MKAKTRLLAALLTVLMIVGILPLSLFALDEALPTGSMEQGEYVERTQQEIEEEFAKVGMSIAKYQTFEKLSSATFAGLINSSSQVILGKNLDYSVDPAVTVDHSQYNDIDDMVGSLNISNQKGGVDIYTEDGGNKVLYFAKTTSTKNAENFIDSQGFVAGGDKWQDVMISLDIKMAGDKIGEAPVFTFVLRPSGPMFVRTLMVNADGELYIGEYSEKAVLGKLSKDGYTRVAIATNREENKYYVYINDQLVNLGGNELFSATTVHEYNTIRGGSTYTANNIPLSSVRMYTVNASIAPDSEHEGIYFDNVIVGKRWVTTDRDIADKVIVESDFKNATDGASVFTNNKVGEVFGTGYASVGGTVYKDAVLYVDEDKDGTVDAIRWTKPTSGYDNVNDQAFMQIGMSTDFNVSISLDVKMGQDGIRGAALIYHDINRDPNRLQIDIVHLSANGTLRVKDANGQHLGNVSKDKYTNVRVDIVTNGFNNDPYYFFYIDGQLVYVSTQVHTDPYLFIRAFRIYACYSKSIDALKNDDVHIKNISIKHTSAYNSLENGVYPFAKIPPAGFIETADGLRYSDGKGGYATEDFYLGSTKYIVSTDGIVINKSTGVLADRDLKTIQTEFNSQGVGLNSYLSFDKWQFADNSTTHKFYSEKSIIEASGVTPPKLSDYSDIKDSSDKVVTSAQSQYDAALVEYNAMLKEKGLLDMTAGSLLPTSYNMQHIGTYADYGRVDRIQIKNFRDSYTVRTESDGNKALYFDWAPATIVYSSDKSDADDGDGVQRADALANNDTFIDLYMGLVDTFPGQSGDANHDFYISVDLKMNGKVIPGVALFSLIYRPEGMTGQGRNIVMLSDVGGIYAGNEYGPQDLVGFLSDEEYTRISIATDRKNNKFYLYINDVLVTPDGHELWAASDIKLMNDKNSKTKNPNDYTAQTMPFSSVRMLSSSGHATTDQNRGLWIDNILTGTRVITKDTTTAIRGYSYDIPALGLEDKLAAPGNRIEKGNPSFFFSANSNYVSVGRPKEDDGSGTIRYVDEDGDGKSDAIEWHAIENCVDAAQPIKDEKDNPGQAFMGIGNAASKGSNLRFSMDIKGGQDGQAGAMGEGDGSLLVFRTASDRTKNGKHVYEIYVRLDANGYLYLNKDNTPIGQLTSEAYTNITIDFICNVTHMPVARVYIDGNLVYTQRIDISSYAGDIGYALTDYHPNFVRIYALYVDQTKNLKDEDIRIRSLAYGSTTDYDVAPERISVFQNDISGMYGVAGIVRCYDGDGSFETEDFEFNGEKYIVSYGGSVVGKESDGREMAPYAPYVDWDHTGTMLKSSPTGRYIGGNADGAGSNNSTINSSRDGFWKTGTLPNGDGVTLYTSYNDTEKGVGSPNDHATYITLDFGGDLNGLKNKVVTIDFDLRLDITDGDTYIGSQAFMFLRGQETHDNKGGRKDKDYPYYITSDGWLVEKVGTEYKKIVKMINKTEFSRISIVVHGPQLDASNNITTPSSIDLYVNGVLILNNIVGHTAAKYLQQIRFLKVCDGDFSIYVKDLYMYESAKPQQFVGMVDGVPTLTSDQAVTPATPANMKQGFVGENGIARYYDELGMPMIDKIFTVEGKVYVADKYGKVECDGTNHLKVTEQGYCIGCGKKQDGVTSLYGTKLVLGSDVKLKFYLDIEAAKAEGSTIEIGLDRDYANGTTVKTAFENVTIEKIGGKDYYVVTYAVSAKDIYSDVTVRLVKDGKVISTEYSYSVADYTVDVQKMTGAEYTPELKALAKALAVYGKNASAALLGTETTNIDDSLVSWNGVTGSGKKDYDQIIKLAKFSLELKSNIKIKVYFSFDAEVAADEYDATIENYIATVGEENLEIKDAGDGTYYFEYEVTAINLATLYEFTIEHEDEGGGMKLSVSALYYAMIMNANADTSVEYKNLMKAIKLYSDAAEAYELTLDNA